METENHKMIKDITESIHQCFDGRDLLSTPTFSTLQALLLLLACPGFSQESLLVASVLRMASILGYNRAQSDRPIIYWTCAVWARWEALESFHHASTEMNRRLATPNLDCATQPDTQSFFGRIYNICSRAEMLCTEGLAHTPVPSISGIPWSAATDTPQIEAYAEGGISPELMQRASGWVRLLETYLLGSESECRTVFMGIHSQQDVFCRFNPFRSIANVCLKSA